MNTSLFPNRRWFFLLIFLLLVGGAAHAQQQRQPYRNLINTRFNTISDGPQSSVVVDVSGSLSTQARKDAVTTRARRAWRAQASIISKQWAVLQKAGVVGDKKAFPISTLLTVRENGRLVLPPRAASRAFGNGKITFRYTGFTPQEEGALRTLADVFYRHITEVYGAPAWTGEVEVVSTGPLDTSTVPDRVRVAFGAYDVSNNRILLPIYDSLESEASALLLMMVHAFHGPLYLSYDGWEQGFARATASIVARRSQADNVGIRDVTARTLYSLLDFYDILNQPPLGNPTFFPPSQRDLPLDLQTSAQMLIPRLGMSGAAWLKVYIENPVFFRQFNAAYYAAYDAAASPKLSGNVPALRQIAGTLLPSGVEGISWSDWYERQFILDTSISPGNKLYAYVIPGEIQSQGGSTFQANTIELVYYQTKPNGDEQVLAGRATATYFDGDGFQLPTGLGPASEQTTVTNGEGFLTTLLFVNDFSATRLTMDFHIGAQTARVYVPAAFTSDFQAAVVGVKDGTVNVSQTTVAPVKTLQATGTVSAGGFSVRPKTSAGAVAAPNELTVTTIRVRDNANGKTYEFRRNIGAGDPLYYAVLRAEADEVTTVSKSFAARDVPYLISLPVRPLSQLVPTALGVSASDFLLSSWNPLKPGYETLGGSQAVTPLEVGRGYWLKAKPANGANSLTLKITGVPPPADTDVTVSTPYGWNLIGTPFAQSARLRDIQVQFALNTYSWEEAIQRNIVSPDLYAFDAARGYVAVSLPDGTLDPWQGYWVRILVPNGATLLIPGPDSPSRSRALVSRAAGASASNRSAVPQWTVRLRVSTSGDSESAEATLGAAAGATDGFDNPWDRELPPDIVPRIGIAFATVSDKEKESGGRYVADIRDVRAAERGTWTVRVHTPQAGPVTLSWSGLGTVPRRTRLTLMDVQTKARISLLRRSGWTFTARADETRTFEIEAEPERSLPLALSDISITRTRSAGGAGAGGSVVAIGYAVSADAEVNLEIKTITGRVLQRLRGDLSPSRATVNSTSAGRTSAGRSVVIWNGRDGNGDPLPAGIYTLTITARGADGAVALQSRPLLLVR